MNQRDGLVQPFEREREIDSAKVTEKPVRETNEEVIESETEFENRDSV